MTIVFLDPHYLTQHNVFSSIYLLANLLISVFFTAGYNSVVHSYHIFRFFDLPRSYCLKMFPRVYSRIGFFSSLYCIIDKHIIIQTWANDAVIHTHSKDDRKAYFNHSIIESKMLAH